MHDAATASVNLSQPSLRPEGFERGERPSGVTPLWRRPGAARMLALLAVYKLGDAFAVGEDL